MAITGTAIVGWVSANATAITAVAAVAGAATTAYASIEQGEQQKAAADYNARIAENNAAYQNDAAVAQAEKIRKVGAEQQAQAAAGLAASGVKLGEGSAVDINRTIGQNTEQDAFNALLSGQRATASGDQTASLLRTSGDNAVSNSYIGAGATVLGSASKLASGWKTTATRT